MTDAGRVADVARAVEAAGLDGLAFTEHPAPSAKWLEAGGHQTVDPFVVQSVQQGMRFAVIENQGGIRRGTLNRVFGDPTKFPIAVAGKTGTAEYCDDVALKNNLCAFGRWPTHSWTVAYAPYENPEIVIMAFAYNAGEGASVAAPIVGLVMQAYFELKSIDLAQSPGG